MANYCSNCGRRLIAGRVCECRAEERIQISKQVQDLFDEIPQMIKKPDTMMKYNCKTGYNSKALLLIGIKAVVLILILLAAVSKIIGTSEMPLNIPLPKMMIVLLAAVYGDAFLQAGICRGIVHMFKGKTTFNQQLCAVGVSTLVDGVCLLVAALLLLLIPRLSIVVLLGGFILSNIFYLNGYAHSVEIDSDRGVYCLAVAQTIYIAAVCAAVYIAIPIITNGSVESLIGKLFEML